MIETNSAAPRFYDVIRKQYGVVLDAVVDADREKALTEMVGALASVVVERAPDHAERIWRGASADVRLSPARPRRKALRWRAAAWLRERGFGFWYALFIMTLAVVGGLA
jgi:hypothetical protein